MSDIQGGWQRARPRMAPVGLDGLTAQFASQPLNFMRRNAMSPPNDFMRQKTEGAIVATPTGHQDVGRTLKSKLAPGSDFVTGNATTINRKAGGGVCFVQVVKHGDPNFPGATGLRVLPVGEDLKVRSDGRWLPIHWLPWQSTSIVEYQIPPVPSNEADPQDEDYPRFFFTAGINGCSVFASGDPTSPMIRHAGIDADLNGSAGEFWRRMMADTQSGFGSSMIKGEVNTHDYMYKGQKAENKKLINEYKDWLATASGSRFEIEVTSPFGCAFGIRYGRYWTLYLQKNAVFQQISFYKGDQVEEVMRSNGSSQTDIFLKGTREMVNLAPNKSYTEPKKLGPIKYGQKEVKVYSRAVLKSLPMQVMEFFPNRTFTADLKETVKLSRTFR